MKLAFITQDFPPDIGGIQTYSLEIAKRMSAMCDDFVLIAPDKANAKEVDQALNFEVCRIKTTNTLIGIMSIPKVIRLLRKRKIDVIFHAQWPTLMVTAIAKKIGLLRFVGVAAHGREFTFNPFHRTKTGSKFYQSYRQYLIPKADFFFPVSHYTANLLTEHGISPDQQAVVINGTDPEMFYPMDMNALKQKYGYADKKIIITITRLIELKAVDTVLRAMPHLIEEFPNLLYLVVGDGSYKNELVKISRELNLEKQVKFLGKVPYEQVNEYYNLSDIYVMPSKKMGERTEAFGIVFLEANACGKPTIGSRTGGIADAVLDEQTGLLVEERNPKELAEAIRRLLRDDALRKRMGEAGRKRVETEANWDAVAQRIYGLIEQQL